MIKHGVSSIVECSTDKILTSIGKKINTSIEHMDTSSANAIEKIKSYFG
jgi:hypothetical protein